MTIPKRIPRKVKFNGVTYTVKKLTASKMPKTEDNETIHVGHCDNEKTEISILNQLSQEAQRGTFEHEAGHASSEESGARKIMESYTEDYMELEEHLCRVWLPCYLEGLRVKVK